MAMSKYGAAQSALTINGINIEQFGDTDPAVTIDDAEDRSVQKDGIGGTSLRLDRVNRPRTLTVNLLPDSDESRQIIAVEKSGVDFVAAFRQIGTNEQVIMYEGTLTRRGPLGRAGRSTVTDEVFTFRFNNSEET